MGGWFFLGVILLVIIVIIILLWFWPKNSEQTSTVNVRNVAHNVEIIDTNWRDYAFYNRLFVTEVLSNSPGLNETVDKLRFIRDSIGQGYSVIFGDKVGKAVTQMLHSKDIILAAIIHKMRSGQHILSDIKELSVLDKQLSETLSRNLSQYVEENTVFRILNKMSDHSVSEIRALFDKDYVEGMRSFQKLLDETGNLIVQLGNGVMNKAFSLSKPNSDNSGR